MKLTGKKLYVADQVSCTSSRVYVKGYEDFMVAQGCGTTTHLPEADIVLVDTCAVNHLKEDSSLELIKSNQVSAKEGAKVIVCGCLAGINPQKLRENFSGDFFSPKTENQLAQILGIDEGEAKFLSPFEVRGRFMGGSDFTDASWKTRLLVRAFTWAHRIDHVLPLSRLPLLGPLLSCSMAANPRAYALTISQGCLGNCSFCVIPMAKGTTQSQPMAAIVDRIRTLVETGVTKIILTSEDTGAYGKDIGATIVDLLRAIHTIPGDFSLYLNFFDPRWLRPYWRELLPILSQGKVRYMQLALQSGSDSVLGRMRRCYQMRHVLPVIREFKKRLPRMAIATQIIVGFPGESDDEFEATRAVLKANLFDYAEIFGYSGRPGAASLRLSGQLPQSLLDQRLRTASRDWLAAKFLPRLEPANPPFSDVPPPEAEAEEPSSPPAESFAV